MLIDGRCPLAGSRLRTESRLSMKKKSTNSNGDKHQPQVILLDDEDFFLSILSLRMQDAVITTFNKPESLIEKINSKEIDLPRFEAILTDNYFGPHSVMTGLELGKMLKDKFNYKGVIILLSSGIFYADQLINAVDYKLEKSAYTYQELTEKTRLTDKDQPLPCRDNKEMAFARHEIRGHLSQLVLAREHFDTVGALTYKKRIISSLKALKTWLPESWLTPTEKLIVGEDFDLIGAEIERLKSKFESSETWFQTKKPLPPNPDIKPEGILIRLKDHNRKRDLQNLGLPKKIEIITHAETAKKKESFYKVLITDDISSINHNQEKQQVIYAANLTNDTLLKRIYYYSEP